MNKLLLIIIGLFILAMSIAATKQFQDDLRAVRSLEEFLR